jgi:gluconolactonase
LAPVPSRNGVPIRIDAQSGKVAKITDEPFKPNGLCFSADYKKVYIADTGKSYYPNAKSIIWVYDVDGGKLRNSKAFAEMTLDSKTGFADGIRCDEDGNIGWQAIAAALCASAPSQDLLGKLFQLRQRRRF